MNWLRRVFGADAGKPSRPAAPDEPEHLLCAGFDCECRGDVGEAERLYRRALETEPADADALYLLGRLAASDRREEESIALFQQAVESRPGETIFMFSLGDALFSARRFAEAAEVYRACVERLPDCTAMRNNYATALIELNRREEARAELERMRALLPNLPQLHFNLAGIYREYGMTDEAIAGYRRALELTPEHPETYSNLLLEMNYSPNQTATEIFAEHQRFGERFGRRYQAPAPDPVWPRRLRIGYVSPDLRNHVVARFIEPILANHDVRRFDVFRYHNHRTKDAVTARLRALPGPWVDCEAFSDAELAERIRADRIDILVDLAGHTDGNRILAFATKPAPVQATYLGYPNTTGLGAVDFRITDAWADPPGESDRLSVERLVRLPHSYFCYRPMAETPAVGPLPALASAAITFGCFNNFAKLSPSFLDAAAQVLLAVPGSRLLLKARPLSIPSVAEPLRRRFESAGVDPQRLDLRGWEPVNHLSVYNQVDIAFDSFPYNGATTTCEALWMGVPVVSLLGDRHAGRLGSSLLNAVGLGDMVARDVAGYVARCARLAGDTGALAELRRELRDRLQRSSIMDEAGFTRRLEECYLEMWLGRSRTVPAAPSDDEKAAQLAQARALREAGRLSDARAVCAGILEKTPDHAEAVTLLWDLAFDAGTPGAAIDALNNAILADDRVASFHYMLGCVLQAQGKTGDAVSAFRQALVLNPGLSKAHNNLGCTLEAAGDLGGAAECYRSAIGLDPRMAQAHYNLGNLYKQMGDARQAIECIERALAIEPRHADWQSNLGSLHYSRLELDAAIARFRAAIEIDPGLGKAYAVLGGALLFTGQVDEAVVAFRKAQSLEPEQPDVNSWLLLAQHYRQGNEPQMLFDSHLAWAERHARGLPRSTVHRGLARANGQRSNQRPARRRLRVGYVSPDFLRHVVANFIEPLLAAHDAAEVEVFGYSNSRFQDEVTQRLRGRCAHWRDIVGFSDNKAADGIRADGIDILVDLAGHTGDGRLLLFARKPAPVQVTWLGYPNTTGLDGMDYRFTDAVADPEGRTGRFHTETLIRLPQGFLCYAPPPESPGAGEPPELANRHVTFGCFNNLAKVTPQMITLWAQILRALPGARIVLKAYGLAAESARWRLQQRFLAEGIEAARIDLRPPEISYAEHLGRYSEIDIALDVFPYNGTTTTCEALWMGLPVVTRAGGTHVSRTGASILTHAGLPEFIAGSDQDYVRIALQLAADFERRRALRAAMRDRLQSSPLLDATGFARSVEAAFRDMWARAVAREGTRT